MKNKQLIITIVAILIVGAGAFFGGMKYQESKSPANRMGQFQGGQGIRNGQQARLGGGAVMGEVISIDDKSITVKTQDGSTKLVLLSDSVTISKTETGSKEDLKTGVQVGVFGTSNSDGTVTAQNIQLNPTFRMGQGGANNQPSPTQ